MKKTHLKIFAMSVIVLILVNGIWNIGGPTIANAYKSTEARSRTTDTHWRITDRAIYLLLKEQEEGLDPDYKFPIQYDLTHFYEEIHWGSWQEDSDGGNTKYHFYDPDLGTGKDVEVWDEDAFDDMWEFGLTIFGSNYFWTSSRVLCERWFSYALKAYANGAKDKAFYWLGRALHLFQDAFVPHHTDAYTDVYTHLPYERLCRDHPDLKYAIDTATEQKWLVLVEPLNEGQITFEIHLGGIDIVKTFEVEPLMESSPGTWLHYAASIAHPYYDTTHAPLVKLLTLYNDDVFMIEVGETLLPLSVGGTIGFIRYFYETLERIYLKGKFVIEEIIPGYWKEETSLKYGIIDVQLTPFPQFIYGYYEVTESVWIPPIYGPVWHPNLYRWDFSQLSWFDDAYKIGAQPLYNLDYFEMYPVLIFYRFGIPTHFSRQEYLEALELLLVGDVNNSEFIAALDLMLIENN